MAIKQFGQYVKLSVTDKGGGGVFATDSLRVDFDIREVKGFSRARFDIYNLNPETIKEISNGDNFVSLSVQLHDNEEFYLAKDLFLSNAMDEAKVPNRVSSLFCFSGIRQDYLEKDIEATIVFPTLENNIRQLFSLANFKGKINFKFFPPGVLEQSPPMTSKKERGSVESCLNKLAKQHYFEYYTEGENMLIMYKPHADNYVATSLFTATPDVVLDTKNMRANPKIGPSTLQVTSNLDERIRPAAILDISNITTATFGGTLTSRNLETGPGLLAEVSAGFSKYYCYQSQHKGSNFTGDWVTTAHATSPTAGLDMPSDNWWS